MRYQPLWVDGFKDGHSPNRDSYPDMFRYRISFSLPSPLKSELKGLNFFSAQNVFIPGVKFIEATTQMMPADIVLLGSMPQSTAIASPTASMVQSSAVKNLALRFMDEIYLNAFFVGDLINATINGESGAVKAVLRQKGYDGLTAHDLEVLRDYTVPGPKFDLRYSGGAYSVESSVYSAKELLVHSVHRTIYIDGTPVESQKTLADGSVSFLSSDGNQSFRITFNAPFDVQNPIGAISYTGTTWVTAQPEHEEPIQGKRAYPWDGSSDIDTTPAASARDAEAFQYLPLALDLITPHVPLESPNVADLASVVGIFSIAVNTVTSLKNIRDFCVWGKEQVMKRTGANMKLRIRGLLTLDKMKQTFPTKAEEAINEILNNSNERKLETVAKAAEPKILEAMKKYMRNEATKQAQKNNGAAYGLSAEDIIHQAHDIADTQATNVFTGEVYASYLNALVDRTVTLKRRNEAFDEKNRLQREINKAGERIRQNRQDLTKKQEELEAKRRLVDKGSIPREKWDDIQREYGREIQKISDKITEDETSTRNDEASRKSHEEAWKKYMKDEAEKKKTEEKRREEFWKHRKDHHTEPKPEHG
ncbi:uncharacterized protein N7459_008289 [Penicillium hispanicum]|uniref:uncharacterized protein n=1 Tax=Penicillium hispanicum TaxID=1080232 RepID=UPI00254177B7|nr:uncharacterized protein N7459_008289 [Penicillium hispanicum]KAJ5573862.1 hypothetical protein N7459_008289 [Penicillium hispanicum]